MNRLHNYKIQFDPCLVNIPKKASLQSRILDFVQRLLHSWSPRNFETPLESRAVLLIDTVSVLKKEGAPNKELMKLYNVRAANFLNDFRSKISHISAFNRDDRFGEALQILSIYIQQIDCFGMLHDETFLFYHKIITTLYDEFFSFVADNYKYEISKTGTIINLDYVSTSIYSCLKLYGIHHFESKEAVKIRLQVDIVAKLPTMIELCKHKAKLILKVALDEKATIDELNKEIFSIEKKLEAFQGVEKSFREKNELEAKVLALYDKRDIAMDSIHFMNQINEYRLNLVKIGIPLDQDNKNDLTELALASGYASLEEMLELDCRKPENIDPSINNSPALADAIPEPVSAEQQVDNSDSELDKLWAKIDKPIPDVPPYNPIHTMSKSM